MARTVSVELKAQVVEYTREIQHADRVTRDLAASIGRLGRDSEVMGREVRSAGRDIRNLGDESDSASRRLGGLRDESDRTRRGLGGLRDESRRSRAGVVDLATEFHRTKAALASMGEEFRRSGRLDVDQFNSLSRKLRDLQRVGQEAGRETGRNFSAGLQGSLATPVLGPALIAGLVGAAIVAAPAVGAAIASGVTLGVGGGALAAGIALAARDPEVQHAWGKLGEDVKAKLSQAGAVFAPSLVRAASTFGETFSRDIMPSIRRDFVSLEPLVDKLVGGAAGFARNVMPGVDKLLETAGPFVKELATQLPNFGNAIGDFFDSVSAGGPGALQFFHDFLDISQKGIVAAGNAVEFLSRGYALISGGANIMTGDVMGAITVWEAFGGRGAAASHEFAVGAAAAIRQVQIMTGDLDSATRAAGSLKAVFDELNGGFINSTQAAIAAEANIDALTEAVKQHGNSLNIDNAAGRDNVGIITRGAELARDAAQAKYIETGSIEAAKATYDGYIGRLRTTAGDLKFNKEKTDALFTSISQMPPLKSTQISLPGIDAAIEKVLSIKTHLNGLQNKTITVTTVQNTETGETRVIRRSSPEFRRYGGIDTYAHGGIDTYARAGLDTYARGGIQSFARAGIYEASGPGLVKFAERETGGEAYIPRLGISQDRAVGLASEVGKWHGFSVMTNHAPIASFAGYRPASYGGGGGGTVKLDITLRNAGGQVMHRELVDYAISTGRTPAQLFPDRR